MMQLFSFCYKRKKAKGMRYRLFVKKGFSIIAYFQRGGKSTKKYTSALDKQRKKDYFCDLFVLLPFWV